MNFAEGVFLAIIITTIAGALMAVVARSIIYAMMGLVSVMFGIGGLYIYLQAPFLAMMQILIYVGAISILIAFAIMLAGPLSQKPQEWTTITRFASGLVVSLAAAGVIYFLVRGAYPEPPGLADVSTAEIGRAIFDRMILPFELISLLIVVSIIGAIMLALLSKAKK